ncbi:MAG TPA: twin-arginine translocation signal domain-containing protein [Gemmatimonadales bacterium]|nr:twin-arginine translocation signal domain-containing protein [Gemmatimonadales bacterium]
MSDSSPNTTDRRGFVGAVATLGAGLALGADTRLQSLVAQQPTGASVVASDDWLDHLKGKHRQLFDVPEPEGGTALRHLRNYLDAWRNAFGVGERDVSVVVTLYARTTPLGLQDAMWEKYQLGAALSLTDPTTNAPLVRNWFAHPKPGDPVADGEPDTSMEILQKRGVVFALCNNALTRWAGRLAKSGAGGGAAADVHADLVAHALPGVVIVPDVLVTMTKAHERGFGYVRS